MPSSRSLINRTLTANGQNLLSWANAGETVKTIEISSDIVGAVGGENCLPRMRITWGSGLAMHTIVADLPGFGRIVVPSVAGSVQIFGEPNAAGGTLVSPSFNVWATLSKGYGGRTDLTYTTQMIMADNGLHHQPLPRGAKNVSLIIPHPPGAGLPGSLGLIGAPPGRWIQYAPAFMGATNYVVRSYEFGDLQAGPKPIHYTYGSTFFGGALVQGGSWMVYSSVSPAPDEHALQFVFGLEV